MHTNYITKFLKAEDIIFEDIIEDEGKIEFHIKMKHRLFTTKWGVLNEGKYFLVPFWCPKVMKCVQICQTQN